MRYTGLISVLVIVLLATTIMPLTAVSYTISADSVYKHISILAADSLEGRETGSEGEWKAALYISSLFFAAGLQPAGDSNSWYQAFDFIRKIDLGQRNNLKINGITLELHEEYVPLPHSGSMEFQFDEIISVNYGITADELRKAKEILGYIPKTNMEEAIKKMIEQRKSEIDKIKGNSIVEEAIV